MTTVDSPLGTVTRDGDRDVVEFRRTYPDPPETVWATLTESDRLARWYGSFTGDARPGGTVQLTLTSAEDGGGPPTPVRIEECEANRRLRVLVEEGDGEAWEISVDLTPAPDGTVLDVRQALPPSFPYSASDVGPGWHWYVDRLGAELAGTTYPAWSDYESLGEHYA
jgi:uncharacterized protein YndB with AHSA1/START domain